MNVRKRRRLESKTDYLARKTLLKSKSNRVVFRKTNKYIIGQYVKSKEAQDYVITGAISKELEQYGWPKSASIKSIPASYLTGFLVGKKINDKGDKEAILDIGLIRSVKKSKIYGFAKGLIDAGIKVNVKQEYLPEEARILGRHTKKSGDVHKIKLAIEKKFT